MDVMDQQKVGPTDFQKTIDELKASGKLPSLSEVHAAVSSTRKEYRPRILKARELPEEKE